MAGRMCFIGCLIVVVALLKGASAETYTVGDELGWTIPPGGSIVYSTWAQGKSFDIGDTLIFNWTGTHDVAQVSKADYDSCTNNPIGSILQTSPAAVNITSNGSTYFICTVKNHCGLGQKVTITVGSSSNSASSLTIGAFSAFLSMIVIFYLSYI